MAINPYFRIRNIDENTGFGRSPDEFNFTPRSELFSDRKSPYEGLFKQPPIGLQQIGAPKVQEVGEDDDQVMMEKWMKELYQPETEATAAYQRHLDQYPTREKPGFGRKLAASLVGLGGDVEKTEKVLHAPYYRKQADWKEQADPRYKAAALERQENVNRLGVAREEVRYRVADRKATETERTNRAREENTRLRNEALNFKARHPNWIFKTDGPNVMAYNPLNPKETVNLGPSGHLSDADKINLQGEWSVEAAAARGDAAVRTAQAGAQASGRDLVVIDGKTYQRDENGNFVLAQGLPPGTPTRPGTPGRTTATTPAQESAVRNNRFQKVYDENFIAQKWLIKPKTANGDWQMADPPTRGYFTSEAREIQAEQEYDAVRKLLGLPPVFGGVTPQSSTSQPTPINVPVSTKPSPQQPSLSAKPEGFQPRADYTTKPKVPTTTAPSQTPWITQVPGKIWGAAEGAGQGGSTGTAYEKQIMTPEGPKTVSPGHVAVRNVQTGEVGEIPRERLAAAIASGKYKEVK